MPTLPAVIGGLVLSSLTGYKVGGAPARVEAPDDSAAGKMAFGWTGPGGAALLRLYRFLIQLEGQI